MGTKLKFVVDGDDLTNVSDCGIDEMICKEVMDSARNKLAPLMSALQQEGGMVIFDIDTRGWEADHCSADLQSRIRQAFSI
ncbi:hypothetical protein [Mucilaginibacter kameinonensis]|uniref:hypothetical protein n=1 Tax=Mucilaginibacter kameinonensis TaxID=452286 RepID=UPI000EF8025B|nr:hypothetical protein [Mucilaginibacter kameinonensis]